MYKLIYSSIEYQGQWARATGKKTKAVLKRMIALALAEQHKYDSCHIEDIAGRTVWEPGLGIVKE